jgi:hypothetical protein
LQDNARIIPDLSDLAKPLAKKMNRLATICDVSNGELVNGYWILEIYASLSRENPVPVLLERFGHEEPYSPGQNSVVLKGIHKILKLTNNRGVLVANLGFDAAIDQLNFLMSTLETCRFLCFGLTRPRTPYTTTGVLRS